MGACDFSEYVTGKSAALAFKAAVEEAEYAYGHAGYTGTIAEKGEFVSIKDTPEKVIKALIKTTPDHEKEYPKLMERLLSSDKKVVVEAIAETLIALGDRRIDDKWGPAGCIEVTPAKDGEDGEYLFFGWASS